MLNNEAPNENGKPQKSDLSPIRNNNSIDINDLKCNDSKIESFILQNNEPALMKRQDKRPNKPNQLNAIVEPIGAGFMN
jgi:hypothetical protein